MSCRPKDAVSVLKDAKTKEETSSDSEDKMAAINKNLAFGKRKPELLLDGGEVVEKRKKGRPRKDKMAAALPQPFTQVRIWSQETCEGSHVRSHLSVVPPQITPAAERDSSRTAATPTPAVVLKLPTPSVQKVFSVQVRPGERLLLII